MRIERTFRHRSTYRLPLQEIVPESRSTMMLSSGGDFLTTAASPPGRPSSWMPTNMAPGNSKHDMKGSVRRGTYGAQSSKGKRSDRNSSQVSNTSEGRDDIITTWVQLLQKRGNRQTSKSVGKRRTKQQHVHTAKTTHFALQSKKTKNQCDNGGDIQASD